MFLWDIPHLLSLASIIATAFASPLHSRTNCRKTKIAVLGAGTAGIFAAVSLLGIFNEYFDSRYSQQAISNASISDFLIVEYNSEIGGRVAHTEFGKDPDGKPYTVELGANWVRALSPYRATQLTEENPSQVQGTVTEGGPENPIWTFVI